MRRVVCSLLAVASIGFAGSTSNEPTGPLTAAAMGSKSVVVTPSEATLATGGTQQFAAQFFQNGKEKKAAFTWSSSDPSIATVNSAGAVTRVSGGGGALTGTTRTEARTAP